MAEGSHTPDSGYGCRKLVPGLSLEAARGSQRRFSRTKLMATRYANHDSLRRRKSLNDSR
jgi:hypothetical protein